MKHEVLETVHVLFQTLLVVYLLLLLGNQFKAFVYPPYLNVLLVVVLVLGVVSVLTRKEEHHVERQPTKWDFILIWVLGVGGAVLVFLKTGSLGWLQYVLTLLSGALIVLLGYLVYEPEHEEKPVYVNLTWKKAASCLK